MWFGGGLHAFFFLMSQQLRLKTKPSKTKAKLAHIAAFITYRSCSSHHYTSAQFLHSRKVKRRIYQERLCSMQRWIISQDIPCFSDVQLIQNSITEIKRITQVCISWRFGSQILYSLWYWKWTYHCLSELI